jgi:hypothetical protein
MELSQRLEQADGLHTPTGLCGIMPVVPATLYGCQTQSCADFQNGFFLTRAQVVAFWNQGLVDPLEQADDPTVSPLRWVRGYVCACGGSMPCMWRNCAWS